MTTKYYNKLYSEADKHISSIKPNVKMLVNEKNHFLRITL